MSTPPYYCERSQRLNKVEAARRPPHCDRKVGQGQGRAGRLFGGSPALLVLPKTMAGPIGQIMAGYVPSHQATFSFLYMSLWMSLANGTSLLWSKLSHGVMETVSPLTSLYFLMCCCVTEY